MIFYPFEEYSHINERTIFNELPRQSPKMIPIQKKKKKNDHHRQYDPRIEYRLSRKSPPSRASLCPPPRGALRIIKRPAARNRAEQRAPFTPPHTQNYPFHTLQPKKKDKIRNAQWRKVTSQPNIFARGKFILRAPARKNIIPRPGARERGGGGRREKRHAELSPGL